MDECAVLEGERIEGRCMYVCMYVDVNRFLYFISMFITYMKNN
jgi:hypothetical protein